MTVLLLLLHRSEQETGGEGCGKRWCRPAFGGVPNTALSARLVQILGFLQPFATEGMEERAKKNTNRRSCEQRLLVPLASNQANMIHAYR